MTDSHLFIIRGDLTHVACDAWMLPTDREYNVEKNWLESVPEVADVLQTSKTDEFSRSETLATPALGWSEAIPLPILTAVPFFGLRNKKDLKKLEQAVRDFVRVGAEAVVSRRKAGFGAQRPVPLLAMPSFGTDGGGGSMKKGTVLRALIESASEAAADSQVDVVIVLRDEKSFALAQQIRKEDTTGWDSLGVDLVNTARTLADEAKAGKLVPFMGAGVSISAGGPTWRKLIEVLADRIELEPSERQELLKGNRNALDQAAYLRSQYIAKGETSRADGGFSEAIAAAVDLKRYGLAPALLASLKTEQAITLNYDTLFERASDDIGDARTVIPGDVSTPSGKWLLKLHGSVTDPDRIVLTRDHYLGYSASREALSAIVKANLITHHLLFVGFGLADDHFHQIVHDVRRALPVAPGRPAPATALTMRKNLLDASLWQGQLTLVPMEEQGGDTSTAGRRLEIFLDALLAFATDGHSYLLDDAYESSLKPAERKLRKRLLEFECDTRADERESAAWPIVDKMLKDLGR